MRYFPMNFKLARATAPFAEIVRTAMPAVAGWDIATAAARHERESHVVGRVRQH